MPSRVPVMRPGLYAIVDVDTLAHASREPRDFARRVLAAGPIAALQLRAKSLGAGAMLDLARSLAPMCREAGVLFFVNDRPDVAALAGADGVHVGMQDLPVAAARQAAPGLLVGVSTHDDDELSTALETDADYLAFGPVWGTRSKHDPAPTVGVARLAQAVARAGGRPVVAIGSVTLARAPEVVAAGATMGAVISALVVDDARVTDTARELHRALGGR